MKHLMYWMRTACCIVFCLTLFIKSYFWQKIFLIQRTRREISSEDVEENKSNSSFIMENKLNLYGLDNKNKNVYLSRQIFISKQVKTNNDGCLSFPNMYYSDSSVSLRKFKRRLPALNVFEQDRKIKNVDCRLFFERNRNLKELHRNINNVPYNWNLTQMDNCTKYIQGSGYITSSLTEEEEMFPIAFSILVYKDIQQFEILLRAIYRPQNVYCIHYDNKVNGFFKVAMRSIVRCFENVFISSKIFDVGWGTMTVLYPELTCMGDLLKYKNWKYFINLTGQEFPLRTNYELVKILKILNGTNNIASTVKRVFIDRWEKSSKPPHNIRPVKGSVHITASREFVDFLINNYTANDFLIWTAGTHIPDETFFASMNHNPHLKAPGSYEGEPETNCKTKPFLTRFKNWRSYTCHGQWVRGICIFGIGDLPLLSSRHELFANKFHLDYQPLTYHCMDELIFNRTRDEYFGVLKFDTTMYESINLTNFVR